MLKITKKINKKLYEVIDDYRKGVLYKVKSITERRNSNIKIT